MKRDVLIEEVKQVVHEIEPDAEIILYGSRSRQDSTNESDWDLLILLDGSVDDNRTDRIRHRLYEIEWKTGEVITSIIRNRGEWNSTLYKTTPFHQNVTREGIIL